MKTQFKYCIIQVDTAKITPWMLKLEEEYEEVAIFQNLLINLNMLCGCSDPYNSLTRCYVCVKMFLGAFAFIYKKENIFQI